jgi:putative Holliday junction resolvase
MGPVTQHQRVLGVDYGTVRVGLSLSDPLGIIAQPMQALKNDAELYLQLHQLSIREHVNLIVVGMPFNLKGQIAQKAEEVQKFIELLKEQLGIEIVTWDERFTTALAHQTMLAMGTKKKERQKRDGRIDSMAAAIMLQGFLDNINNSHSD